MLSQHHGNCDGRIIVSIGQHGEHMFMGPQETFEHSVTVPPYFHTLDFINEDKCTWNSFSKLHFHVKQLQLL